VFSLLFAGNFAGIARSLVAVPEASLIKIEDAFGLSKPLTRLIEVIAQGVGGVSAPYLIRKTAEARAHEIKTISDALKEVAENAKLPVKYQAGAIEVWQKPEDGTLALAGGSIDERFASRLNYRERKRQENIEHVTSVAAGELAGETEVPNERPDEDWITRFFGAAEDVTNSQLQELWGRILAGEIKAPGSYSLRTLEFVKNIGKTEAELFQKLGKLALNWGKIAFIAVNDKDWLTRERKIYMSEHFQLAELGAMYPTDLAMNVFSDPAQTNIGLSGDDHVLVVERDKIASKIELPIWKYTDIGRELLSLVVRPLDDAYYEMIGRWFLARGGRATIAKIMKRTESGLRFGVIKTIEAEPPPPV
jgi:Protein of unknown function (DUF2806)